MFQYLSPESLLLSLTIMQQS